MALQNNQQIANSPQASSVTGSTNFGGPIGAGFSMHLWGAPFMGSSSLFGEDGYYVIIQNTGTANIEITFGLTMVGLVLYPSATFETAVAQGANIWVNNLAVAPGPSISAQAIVYR
jgi:hypothetical protein